MTLAMTPIVEDVRVAAAVSWAAAGLSLGVAAWAAVGFRRARGTTLAAPAAWCVVSMLTCAAVDAGLAWSGAWDQTLGASIWRYAAAVSTCCPLMAVLGAKRPQDRGWQWIVVSLWVTLLVPAGHALAAPSADRLELFVAWRWLLAALLAMGLLNYLPTRHALAALLAAAGQTLLLCEYFFEPTDDLGTHVAIRIYGPGLLLLACAAAESVRTRPRDHVDDPRSLRWLAFRNGWGAFWALRVMQRVNQTAEAGEWPLRLEWGGFETTDAAPKDSLDETTAAKVDQALDSILWRFERTKSP